MSRVPNVLICLEEGSDVQRLTSPQIPMNGPVEGELERATVKGPAIQFDQRIALLSQRHAYETACLVDILIFGAVQFLNLVFLNFRPLKFVPFESPVS